VGRRPVADDHLSHTYIQASTIISDGLVINPPRQERQAPHRDQRQRVRQG